MILGRRHFDPHTATKLGLAAWGWLLALMPGALCAQQLWPTPAFLPTQSAIPTPSAGSYTQQAQILRERMVQNAVQNAQNGANFAQPASGVDPQIHRQTQVPAQSVSTGTTAHQSSRYAWQQNPPPTPGTGLPRTPTAPLYPSQSLRVPPPTGPMNMRPMPAEEDLPSPSDQIVPQAKPTPRPPTTPETLPAVPSPSMYSRPPAVPQRPQMPQGAPYPLSPQYPPSSLPLQSSPFALPVSQAPDGGETEYKFPKLEDSIIVRDHPPSLPNGPAQSAPYSDSDFAPTQYHPEQPYDPEAEVATFGGKKLVRTQRPWVEWFRPQYDTGPIPRYPEIFGPTNVFTPQFMVYGDYRIGSSYIDPGVGDDVGKAANRLNLDLDLKLTATERIHAFIDPFTNGNTFTSVVYSHGEAEFVNGLNGNFQTFFFEGDLGAIVGGAMGIDAPFDLPFTVGRLPLLFQNGIWMEDNLLGAAVAIPARNSPWLDWSNYDVTYFVAIDEVTSNAFGTDDSAAHVFGSHWFIDAYKGYLEIGWAYLDDHTGQGLSYHNIGISFQRRYFNTVSNAMRCIVNVAQDPNGGVKTADGVLLLMENVFITDSPYFKLPYFNLFAGFGNPQSVARNANAQGVLRNTGINFESDNLTNYPTLDNTANDTWGAALGLDLLASDLSQQLIVEAAVVQVMGDDPLRRAKGNQYAAGIRYQRPLSNSWLFRADAMHGWRENDSDITGARIELRHKF